MRALCLTPHPWEAASSRYRVLQYVPHLEAHGIQCTVSPFLSPEFYRIAYRPGRWGRKLAYFLACSLRRVRDVIRSGRYDVVVIHLEAFPIGPPVIEWLLWLRGIPVVFDLDDAIFLPRQSLANPAMARLRTPDKLAQILRWSRSVVTCNDYLRDYARRFNADVHMIPTCVNVEQFRVPDERPQRERPLIGWIGSFSTAPYLEPLKPVFAQLAKRCPFTLKIIGSVRPFHIPGVEIVQEPWTIERDVESFQELDIGVYPLPDEPWVLGKTGFKTVQYMSVGVPCVVSDVGRNREIVKNGINGFLAGSTESWINRLSELIDQPELRRRLGMEGRRTVEERFSMHRYVPAYVELLSKAGGHPLRARAKHDGREPSMTAAGSQGAGAARSGDR